ncbi:hypothetical protein AX777_05935 [Sphingobium yanoikuyae]|uniref:Uncharacterized protein n=1 Tax=Sphingobium yanoikuyae TaxID=13690 RepID=A0A177JPE7_SPHYA|nr:hypothetical protein [Sphingobium yanoikuyae]OAH42777.1 hypothetical protein AX777_05935 [Sphingobium yanoikuyae]
MARNKTPPPPTQAQVDKHWKAQEKSVFQPPYTRDPGLTIANTPGEVSRIVDAARDGEIVPAFKLRNGEQLIEDPVARTSELIVKAHKGMPKEDFAKLIASPLDQQIYHAHYGHMSDFQRCQVWARIEKQTFEKQQAALAEAHRIHQREQKKTDQLLKSRSMQERMLKAAAITGKVIDGE